MAISKLSLSSNPLCPLAIPHSVGTKPKVLMTVQSQWHAHWLHKGRGIRMVVQKVEGFSLFCSSATGVA